MRRNTVVSAIIICLLTAGFAAAAEKNPFLARAGEFRILVELLPQELKDAGITQQQIKEKVELYCTANGLEVDDTSSDYLYVQLKGLSITVSGKTLGYAYNGKMLFAQAVRSTVSTDIYKAFTWQSPGFTGISKKQLLLQEIDLCLKSEVGNLAVSIRNSR